MTVVQTLPALDSGGVERGTLEIARALVAAGHRSIVISRGGRMVQQLETEGSEHIVLPVDRKSLSSLLQVSAFRKQLQALKPDILHARSRVPAWIAWLAWRKLPVNDRPRFVTTVHGLYSVSFYSAIMTKGERVIAVSETVRDYIRKNYPHCPDSAIRLIYRGVDPAEFPHGYQPTAAWLEKWRSDYPQLTGKTVLTLPGRITRLKGHEAFITLIERLKTQGLPVHGLIVGGAEAKKQAYLQEIEAAVRQRGLDSDITFTGHRSDIRDIFSQSHIAFSLSSKAETFGRTTLEALSIGTPVVGWNHGGVGEILAACYPQGAVVKDDVESLITACETLVRNPVTVPPVQTFRLADMCAQTLAVYEELTQGRT
ncbi:MAG TPA: glycosyltransferase family 4 protein [Fluviicoccus sp.]|nr:glycosyltransferase family 4 protein [Fluviicoccus sp.]